MEFPSDCNKIHLIIPVILMVFLFPAFVFSLPSYININEGFFGIGNLTNVSDHYFILNFTYDNLSIDTCLLNLYNSTITNYTMSKYNETLDGYCILNVTDQTDGNWNYSVYINDSDNNWTWNGTWFVTVDTINPSLTLNSPFNTIYNTTEIEVNFTASDINLNTAGCMTFLNGSLRMITNCENTTIEVIDNAENYLEVRVYDAAGNSNITNVSFTVDTLSIPPTIYYPTNVSYNSTSLEVNFSYNESHIDSCWFDHNGTNTTLPGCSNYSFVAVDDSSTSLILYINDTVGNLNATIVNYTVDTTFPSDFTLYSPTIANESNSSSVNFSVNFTVVDANLASCILEFNNGSATNYTMSVSRNSTGGCCNYSLYEQLDGHWNYTIYANDTAGNMNQSYFYHNWFEGDLPEVIIYLPGNTTYNSTTIVLNYSSSDVHGVDTTWYQYGANNVTLTANTTFAATDDSASSIIIWANDSAGNEGYSIANFTVDTTAPTIAFNIPGNVSVNNLGFNFSFGETISWAGYSLDGAANITNTSVSEWTGNFAYLSNAAHNVTVYANDSVGNMGKATRYFTFDNITPTYTLNYPTNTTYSSNLSIKLNYSASDTHLDKVYYSLDNLTNFTLSNNITFNVSDEGYHYLWFHVNDTAGNVNSTQLGFTVDMTDPTITPLSPDAGATWSSSQTVLFRYNITDLRIKNCTLYIDSASSINDTTIDVNETNVFSKTLTNDDYTWYIRCYDYVNRRAVMSSRSLTVSYTSGDSGSSGSGSGSGESSSSGGSETQPVKATKTWDTISIGTPAEMTISNDDIPIKKIRITARNEISGVSLSVETLTTKPTETSTPSGNAYKYLKIDAPAIEETNVDEISLEFDVSKTWIDSNKIDPESVVLNRYFGGSWNNLSTELISSTSSVYQYKAITPAFSFFSITGLERPEICTANAKACVNSTYIKTCSSDMTEWVFSKCEYGCNNDTKTCFEAMSGNCSNGEFKCQGDGLWICENESWKFEIICKYGCLNNLCQIGTDNMIWYMIIIGGGAAAGSIFVFFLWHEKIHHTTKVGQPARNPIQRGSATVYNPMVLNKLNEIGKKAKHSFEMPVPPEELKMDKPQGVWLRGRLRKWNEKE